MKATFDKSWTCLNLKFYFDFASSIALLHAIATDLVHIKFGAHILQWQMREQ